MCSSKLFCEAGSVGVRSKGLFAVKGKFMVGCRRQSGGGRPYDTKDEHRMQIRYCHRICQLTSALSGPREALTSAPQAR